MTIERISFPEGLPVKEVDLQEPALLLMDHIDKAQSVPTGEHDITPKVWRKNVYKYNLLVNPDGSGVLRTLPRYKGSRSQLVGHGRTEPTREGGRTINIPQEQSAFAIVGPKRNDPQIYLFEYLVHIPGPSPSEGTDIASPEKQRQESVISVEITDINEAKKLIVEDAKQKVLELDWQRFGVDLSEVGEYFELVYPLILRQSERNFAINMLNEENPTEKGWLERAPFDHKSNIVDNYWLALLRDSIDPQEATLIRDWIFMKAPEPIAGIKNLTSLEVVTHFMLESSDFREAAVRTHQYLKDHRDQPNQR